eukprot:1159612-Pelagomonas_calceolata.AAC.1
MGHTYLKYERVQQEWPACIKEHRDGLSNSKCSLRNTGMGHTYLEYERVQQEWPVCIKEHRDGSYVFEV